MALHILLACRVSGGKSAESLMGFLCRWLTFSQDAFRISLSLTFEHFKMCVAEGLLEWRLISCSFSSADLHVQFLPQVRGILSYDFFKLSASSLTLLLEYPLPLWTTPFPVLPEAFLISFTEFFSSGISVRLFLRTSFSLVRDSFHSSVLLPSSLSCPPEFSCSSLNFFMMAIFAFSVS